MTRSETAKVNRFLDRLDYPLRAEMNAVRLIILGVNTKISEQIIESGAPSFYYKECMATFSTNKRKCLTLIFHNGAMLNDCIGLFTGEHETKRIVRFKNMNDVKCKEANLKKAVNDWIHIMES